MIIQNRFFSVIAPNVKYEDINSAFFLCPLYKGSITKSKIRLTLYWCFERKTQEVSREGSQILLRYQLSIKTVRCPLDRKAVIAAMGGDFFREASEDSSGGGSSGRWEPDVNGHWILTPFGHWKMPPLVNFIHESCASLSLTKPALTFSLSR